MIVKAPTAELRENQKDQDSLPPYDVLDQILERLVEREEPIASIVAAGFDRDTVLKVERMLNLAEYKRRQAAPGVKVTLKNFGRDRRYPIVNRFRDPGTPLPAARPSAAQGRRSQQDRSVRFLTDPITGTVCQRRGHEGRPDRAHRAGWDRAWIAALVGLGGVRPEAPRAPAVGGLRFAMRGAAARRRGARGRDRPPWASTRGCDICRARSSFTTMSPCSTVPSSTPLSALAQLSPGRRQLQPLSNA